MTLFGQNVFWQGEDGQINIRALLVMGLGTVDDMDPDSLPLGLAALYDRQGRRGSAIISVPW